MAQYNELPVYKATYDLLLAIFQFTKEFSKEYKYTVGESLKKETIELLTLIYRANTRHQKADVLQMAREQIEVIRLLIRVMKDMKQISLEEFVKINSRNETVVNYPMPRTQGVIEAVSKEFLNSFLFSVSLCAYSVYLCLTMTYKFH